MFSVLLTAAAIIAVNTFGYWAHRALHQRWMGKLYKAHMTHHEVLYPSHDFSSAEYRDAGKDSTTWTFIVLGAPLLVSPVLAAVTGCISFGLAVWLVAVLGFFGLLNSWIHDWMHLTSHWSHLIPGFSKLVELHRVHHVDMSKNFGIFSFIWDKVCKTYKEVL
jgi:sterol desaturase/sphingolipid hydroxylase (fatty acid hydroxylase superfamily)